MARGDSESRGAEGDVAGCHPNSRERGSDDQDPERLDYNAWLRGLNDATDAAISGCIPVSGRSRSPGFPMVCMSSKTVQNRPSRESPACISSTPGSWGRIFGAQASEESGDSGVSSRWPRETSTERGARPDPLRMPRTTLPSERCERWKVARHKATFPRTGRGAFHKE